MPKHLFYQKNYLKNCLLWDNMSKRNTKRHRAHWAVLVMGCVWLFVLHTRFNSAFRSVFRFVSDNISDNFCIVCTQTAFFIEKQKALGDFQVIFQKIFALFVPDLTCFFIRKLKNVICEYDRLNGWSSTLQAAWYIRHVRWTCFIYIALKICYFCKNLSIINNCFFLPR